MLASIFKIIFDIPLPFTKLVYIYMYKINVMKKTKLVSFTLKLETITRLENLVKEKSINRSALVDRLINEEINKEGNKNAN